MVVNLSDTPSQGRVRVPWDDLKGRCGVCGMSSRPQSTSGMGMRCAVRGSMWIFRLGVSIFWNGCNTIRDFAFLPVLRLRNTQGEGALPANHPHPTARSRGEGTTFFPCSSSPWGNRRQGAPIVTIPAG